MRMYQLMPIWPASNQGYVRGEHACCLPGVSCPTCKATWGGAGVEYPCHTKWDPDLLEYCGKEVITWGEFLKIKSRLPKNIPLLWPGTHFGPIVGRFDGVKVPFDFMWLRSWTLLLTQRAVDALQNLLGCLSRA